MPCGSNTLKLAHRGGRASAWIELEPGRPRPGARADRPRAGRLQQQGGLVRGVDQMPRGLPRGYLRPDGLSVRQNAALKVRIGA